MKREEFERAIADNERTVLDLVREYDTAQGEVSLLRVQHKIMAHVLAHRILVRDLARFDERQALAPAVFG